MSIKTWLVLIITDWLLSNHPGQVMQDAWEYTGPGHADYTQDITKQITWQADYTEDYQDIRR